MVEQNCNENSAVQAIGSGAGRGRDNDEKSETTTRSQTQAEMQCHVHHEEEWLELLCLPSSSIQRRRAVGRLWRQAGNLIGDSQGN